MKKGSHCTPEQKKNMSEAKKGCTPWNKNIPCSEETKANISKTLTGRFTGEDNPNYKNRGENSPLYKTKHKPETIEKMRVKKMGENNPFYGLEHSKEQKEIWSIDRTGEKHPSWIDGRSFEPYPCAWTRLLRESIRLRDGYICQKCGKTEEENEERLSIHHIDYDKDNCNPTNLITLCRSCNAIVNSDREYWQKIFEERNNKGGRAT